LISLRSFAGETARAPLVPSYSNMRAARRHGGRALCCARIEGVWMRLTSRPELPTAGLSANDLTEDLLQRGTDLPEVSRKLGPNILDRGNDRERNAGRNQTYSMSVAPDSSTTNFRIVFIFDHGHGSLKDVGIGSSKSDQTTSVVIRSVLPRSVLQRNRASYSGQQKGPTNSGALKKGYIRPFYAACADSACWLTSASARLLRALSVAFSSLSVASSSLTASL
jgi:hypothetical protein